MTDRWLEHGHEMDGTDLTPVFSSSSMRVEGAGAPAPTRRISGWRAVVVGGGLAVLATLGVVGVANAIGDNLFPSMGSTSPASVWQNPVPPAEPTPTTVVVPTTATTIPTAIPTTVPSSAPSTVPTTTPTTTPSSRAAASPSGPVTTAASPTTSTLDQDDDDQVVDDLVDDDSGGSSGSGSDDSGSSGSSGSDDSGSDDIDDD